MTAELLTTYAQGTVSGAEVVIIGFFVLVVIGAIVGIVLAMRRRGR
ncbi:MAG: hypothetical protein ABW224_12570 [Kibdelosporangium sp.]